MKNNESGQSTSKAKDKHRPNKTRYKKIFSIVIGIAVILFFLFLSISFYLEKKYDNKIYPNTYIGTINLANKTYLEAIDEIENKYSTFDSSGLLFSYQDNVQAIPTTYIMDENSGISLDILNIDIAATVDTAYGIGRNDNWWKNNWQKIKSLFWSNNKEIQYTLNEEDLIIILKEKYSNFENPAQDAKLSFTDDAEIEVIEEKSGEAFVWEKVVQQLRNNIEASENKTIYLNLETDYPKLKKANTDSLVEKTKQILNLGSVTLSSETDTWEEDRETLQKWLSFSPTDLILNKEEVENSLKSIAEEIDQPVKEGKFNINILENDEVKIEQFQEGEDGLEINIAKTTEQIAEQWLKNKSTKIDLIIEVTHPKATPDNINDLGIKELLGTGHTNFGGSPGNRIVNIKKGAEILNGLLIAPDETFSLVKTLGHIDGANGWLPELVIKENKTIPEYGGGLCQIGTTSFRAAMMSGLPIVERQNHSYVVSYYNYKGLAGVDATIYEPKPDFRFTNNTGHYILWRSRIEGADIYFEFWGTSDGRNGYFTDPSNYNHVAAPEPIITEVDDLEPGEMSCSEKAHNGLTASFDYIIEWPDGHKDEQTFTSVYKALPSVCRKGKEDAATTVENPVNTNTVPSTNTNKVKTNKNKNTNAGKNTNKKQSQ